ncbi:hypothetical protein KFE25_001612 [Diacronema lutheri]|uniref:PsbP C-terminal domain-containing protein n=2 Tax=Diacronema lutheri TaxID=2081491 RepID=A0A8J5XE53_DIALT|nr:hypothetical protein KFE25_001612 [Diacronema lutheri]
MAVVVLFALSCSHSTTTTTRRSFVASSSALIALPRAVVAAPTSVYTDAASGVSFSYPSDWALDKKTLDRAQLPLVIVSKSGAGPSGTAPAYAFLAINSIRGDYMSLGSFGSPADVLATLVPPAGTPGVTSRVLASANKGKTYEFEYVLEFESGPTRHLRTAFGLSSSPTGADFLVTLTAQAEEPGYADVKAELDAIVASMRF